MKYTIIFGGKAGQGPNILSEIVSQGLINQGYSVFYSRDYQSLIRGGHNFNLLTFSEKPVSSNTSKADILVCLDENTKNLHKSDIKKETIILEGNNSNMYFAGVLYKILGIEFSILESQLKKLKNFDQNLKDAKEGYEKEKRQIKLDKPLKKKYNFINGSQAIAHSSIESGLDLYYAYPMTPATPLMMELGQLQLENKHKVIELENEIAVMIAGLGSSIAGKISMVGTSGGGFDLMTEGLSMAGMAEIPIVVYLAQRPGPGTGVATYTSQGDLNLALHSGHGEFNRIVIAPGDPQESRQATNDCFYFSQKYRVPCILLSDKHLGESKYTQEDTIKVKQIKSSIKIGERFNSYEFDRQKDNTATEEAEVIKKNFELRMKKAKEIAEEAEKFQTYKISGNKNSKNIIIFWGSTKGAVLDAISDKNLDIKTLQIIYLEPFSKKAIEEIKKHKDNIIIIENNASSPLSRLITEKTGIIINDKNKILRYDGRPFFSDELGEEISRRLK